MNRKEALRILGLDEEAKLDDIKTAYKETAQILHPDRFASNKKLQDRATEQFKNLQEAYEFLTSGKGSRSKVSGGGRSRAGATDGYRSGASCGKGAARAASGYTEADEIEARLSGISAAKTQLVAQRDVAYDERRNGAVMAGIGALVALICGRKPGLLMIVAGIAGTAAVWGIIQVVSAQRTIGVLDEHISELNAEKKKLMRQLEDLEDLE